MKTRKLPIFLEIMKSSFYVIILILITYTISQLITFWIFTNEYERDLLKDRYKEVISLSKNVNSGISENAFNEYLQKLSKGENDEYIRIYSLDRIFYESQSEIWEDIGTNYVNQDVEIKSKFLNFNLYIVLIAPLEIDNYQYTVQIIRESDMLNEFIESSLPTLIFTLILGLVLSAIGAMYVSKKFINKLRRLIATMNEIKEEVDLNKLDEIYPKMVVYEVIEQYRVLNPNVKYIVNIEENIKMKIAPNDLKQLLIIFIDNSIKYNDKENIEIEISLLKENSKIRLEVKDNGIGIPKDEIKNVMKRLYKVDKYRVNNNSFGIGLSIANKVVNNYKANINIQSEINKYTKIMISFPG